VGELKNSGRYDYVLKNKNLKEAESKLKEIILKEIKVKKQ
jgi:guanylate kinase